MQCSTRLIKRFNTLKSLDTMSITCDLQHLKGYPKIKIVIIYSPSFQTCTTNFLLWNNVGNQTTFEQIQSRDKNKNTETFLRIRYFVSIQKKVIQFWNEMSKCSVFNYLTTGFGIFFFFFIQQNHKQQQNKPANTCSNNTN